MAKKKKRKTNPRRLPISQQDLKLAKKNAERIAVDTATALALMVLHDKFGMEQEELIRFWKEIENLCDSVVTGRVKTPELEDVLLDECGIELKRS